MTKVELLKADATYGFKQFTDAIDGVTEAQAWAVLPNLGSDYLHTDGSIHAIVHHVAGCKRVKASIMFGKSLYRWRDLYEDVQKFEPNWERAVEFLHESHRIWMDAWADLSDDQLDEMRPTDWGSDRLITEILRITSQHDAYHAGQIAVLRYAIGESTEKPPSIAEDILKYCRDLPHW
jgi:uncharacterized damage-inducible protein DinB